MSKPLERCPEGHEAEIIQPIGLNGYRVECKGTIKCWIGKLCKSKSWAARNWNAVMKPYRESKEIKPQHRNPGPQRNEPCM